MRSRDQLLVVWSITGIVMKSDGFDDFLGNIMRLEVEGANGRMVPAKQGALGSENERVPKTGPGGVLVFGLG